MELEPITCRGKVGYTLDKSPANCRCKDAKTSQIYHSLTRFFWLMMEFAINCTLCDSHHHIYILNIFSRPKVICRPISTAVAGCDVEFVTDEQQEDVRMIIHFNWNFLCGTHSVPSQ